MTTPISELSERAQDIFRIVVENYLEDGVPVGSRTISKASGLDLSPTSVRNVMQDLEELGLLAAPHTSAGRMPTESGLRLFVDAMMQVAQPSLEERRAIESQLSRPGPIEQALEQTSTILSDLSGAAGMVMVPRKEPRLAQFSLVDLGQGRVLAVLVGADGSIENRVFSFDHAPSSSMLEEAGNYITARLEGRTLAQAGTAIEQELAAGQTQLDEVACKLVQSGIATWSEDASRRPVLIVRGQANLLDDQALEDLERVRNLLQDLENKQSIAAILENARKAQATRIFIGSENRLFALSGSSVIASPYRDKEGSVVGVLGVIGPTRLNYARVVPMVDFTARLLGKRIG